MSRRNQSRRRRTYGRRLHEVRERRPGAEPGDPWVDDAELELDADWPAVEAVEERAAYDVARGFAR